MSLHPEPIPTVPEETARIARAAFPKENVYMRMFDEFGSFVTDQEFAHLFSNFGQPAYAPWRLALVTVMQFAEGLCDRQAAEAVRSRLDWKYALALELTDPGFDFSLLSEFRTRLVEGHAEHLLFDAMLRCFKERGLLKARTRQRTDSTHVLAAIRVLNRLELVGETLRAALNTLALVAPDWLRQQINPDWFDRYSDRLESYRLPKSKTEQTQLAEIIGQDGRQLLDAIYESQTPSWLRELPMVDILRQVWLQQFYQTQKDIQLREQLPPSAQLIQSPYDAQARYGTKRTMSWVGYKVHLTETCTKDAPHLITQVVTTAATTTDVMVTETIEQGLAQQGLLPDEHVVDAGYINARQVLNSQQARGIHLVGPVLPESSWQVREGKGFSVEYFEINWSEQKATCPDGCQSSKWYPTHKDGQEVVQIEFATQDCRKCPTRELCTRSPQKPRRLVVRPEAQHELLQQRRKWQATEEFKKKYASRAGIEGTLSQAIRGLELRQCRYVGQAKAHLQHVMTAAAMNIIRVVAWLKGDTLSQTRLSHFATLAILA
jgi:transposase